MELKTVLLAIGGMNAEELNRVIEQVKLRRNMIAQVNKSAFRVGDKVEWNGKYGGIDKGTIKSIGPKNVKVIAETGVLWTIHPNLLRQA